MINLRRMRPSLPAAGRGVDSSRQTASAGKAREDPSPSYELVSSWLREVLGGENGSGDVGPVDDLVAASCAHLSLRGFIVHFPGPLCGMTAAASRALQTRQSELCSSRQVPPHALQSVASGITDSRPNEIRLPQRAHSPYAPVSRRRSAAAIAASRACCRSCNTASSSSGADCSGLQASQSSMNYPLADSSWNATATRSPPPSLT